MSDVPGSDMTDYDADSSDDYDDDEDEADVAFEASADDDSDEFEDDEDGDDEVGAEGNRLVGGTPRTVLEYLARNIVDEPDGVFVEAGEPRSRGERTEIELRLHVAPADMGKVIGRRGRVAQALRQVVSAAASREGIKATLDIVD